MRPLFVLLVLMLFAVPSFAQERPVTKSTWGSVKTMYANPVPIMVTTEVGRTIVKPGVEMNFAAPNLTGYSMVKATSVIKIVDRNENDDDYLVTFDLPIYYCPANWRVLAMSWYGVWNEQTPMLQPYGFSATSSGYRMKFIYGNGKAWLHGIVMSPSNWALYFR